MKEKVEETFHLPVSLLKSRGATDESPIGVAPFEGGGRWLMKGKVTGLIPTQSFLEQDGRPLFLAAPVTAHPGNKEEK